jgi:hypothetical protein
VFEEPLLEDPHCPALDALLSDSESTRAHKVSGLTDQDRETRPLRWANIAAGTSPWGQVRRMSILDILLGKPIATSDERGEQVGVSAGIPIFGLDALSSAAYGPEAALTLLIRSVCNADPGTPRALRDCAGRRIALPHQRGRLRADEEEVATECKKGKF